MVDSDDINTIRVIELATRPGRFSQQIKERLEHFPDHQPQDVTYAEAERLAKGINDLARSVLDEQERGNYG